MLRTSEGADRLGTAAVVRRYKDLTRVERAFRSLKTVDLQIRPIRHRVEGRVRAHLFLCLLAYYVQWHLRQALAPLLFESVVLRITATSPLLRLLSTMLFMHCRPTIGAAA